MYGRYNFKKSQEKIIHLHEMVYIKIYAKNEKKKKIETLIETKKNLQSRYRNGIWD